ncbi:MAG: ubiquinol-cytochrome c reductase iron-sulfur subunit [Pseudomonadota bacterium]|nr:ubiquinol-cytochrome c reductase iron-sulfur subunit [Pseudomonadota bacterium]
MSSAEGVNVSRRRMLIGTTAVVGGVGMVAAVAPFVKSWNPSAKAKAAGAPVTQDISAIEAGQMIVVEWRGIPVFVVNRTAEMVANLPKNDDQIADPASEKSEQPDYAKNPTRSRTPEVMVVTGVCTHLGCAPNYRPEVGAADLGGSNWVGGFFCPCHGSKYDLAGRVFKGQPAPANLSVPPYVLDGNILTIGEG